MALDAPNVAEYLTRAFASQEQHQVLGFPREPTSRTGFRYFTPKDLGLLTDRAAAHYIHNGLQVRRRSDRPLVVGIWGAGTIEWVATFFAIIVMGHTPLIVSSRLSGEVAEALMKKGQGDTLILSSSNALDSAASFNTIQLVNAEQLEATQSPSMQTRCGPTVINKSDLAWILHSSGSTGLPKLFEERHSRGVEKLRRGIAWFASTDREWVSSAVYNSIGLRMLLLSPLKKQPVVYDNDRIPFTKQGLVEILEEVQPNAAWVTTYSLEMITAHPRGIDNLVKCDQVCHFGAVFPKVMGDELVQRGVRLSTNYGMSEASQLLSSGLRSKNDTDWDYMTSLQLVKDHTLFKPIGMTGSGFSVSKADQLYELICLESCPGVNESMKTSSDPPKSYHTGDLFLKHPSKEPRWKIVGRMDDQLKIYHEDRQVVVDCLLYEERIKRGNEDVLDDVVLFGQGQSRLGVLVFAEKATGHVKQAVIEQVWASVEHEINQRMKIGVEKDMVVVVTGIPQQSLPRTTKMNLIRPQIYLRYKEQIEAAYNDGSNNCVNGHTRQR